MGELRSYTLEWPRMGDGRASSGRGVGRVVSKGSGGGCGSWWWWRKGFVGGRS